jgi:hypothetical protein
MLDFDFDDIDEPLDSDDDTVIHCGNKKKSRNSPTKGGSGEWKSTMLVFCQQKQQTSLSLNIPRKERPSLTANVPNTFRTVEL